jgi:hypothetical protein
VHVIDSALGRRLLAFWALALALVSVPRAVLAQDKEQCSSSYTENQRDRKAGKLLSAQAHLRVCSALSCADFIQADCAVWLAEVEAQMPSVVVAAKGLDGTDTSLVEVYDSGVLLASVLDGRPIFMDPGPHTLEFRHRGAPPATQNVVVRAGEKNRVLEVSFAKPSAPPALPPTVVPAVPVAPASEPPILGIAGLVTMGLGLGGIAGFIGLAVSGTAKFDELDRSCGSLAPALLTQTCTEEQISPVQSQLIAGDVLLGVGLGLTALGLVFTIVDFSGDQPVSFSLTTKPGAIDAAIRF